MIKKVDRIKSIAEAHLLEKLGVGMGGISIQGHSIFSDDRVVDLETAMAIGQNSSMKLVCEVLPAGSPQDTLNLNGCELILGIIKIGVNSL